MKTCAILDLGLIGYAPALELQARLVEARKAATIGDVLLLCEHRHVITQGRNGKREHLLASEDVLRQKGVEFFSTNRGGDITYHGPGQLVGYPILDLNELRRDVRWYVDLLEETMIRATAEFGIVAERVTCKRGVWVRTADGPEEKLAAIGVHLSRWVTSHGFAYNVSTDLRYFDLMIPCGISGRKATSLEKILGRACAVSTVKKAVVKHFAEVFAFDMQETSRAEFLNQLPAAGRAAAATEAARGELHLAAAPSVM